MSNIALPWAKYANTHYSLVLSRVVHKSTAHCGQIRFGNSLVRKKYYIIVYSSDLNIDNYAQAENYGAISVYNNIKFYSSIEEAKIVVDENLLKLGWKLMSDKDMILL